MLADKYLIAVVGPTAIGKTALAIEIAKHYQTEIISADSRQFYREMSIGTAKPTPEELSQASHHFINSHKITEEFTVGDFEEEGLKKLTSIFEKQNIAVLVGGSGLFVNAIIEGFDDLPKAPVEIRNELNNLFEKNGILPLQEKLKTLDPDYFTEVDIQNPQRIIRALEVCLATGQSFSSYRKRTKKKRPFSTIKIGLNTDREILYQQINQRVDKMMEAGLLEEVKNLIALRKCNALNTVGYTELFEYFDEELTLEAAIAAIKQNTRRFAKRQLTWFRKDQEIVWFLPGQYAEIMNFIESQLSMPEL